jgi:hypothetical protein
MFRGHRLLSNSLTSVRNGAFGQSVGRLYLSEHFNSVNFLSHVTKNNITKSITVHRTPLPFNSPPQHIQTLQVSGIRVRSRGKRASSKLLADCRSAHSSYQLQASLRTRRYPTLEWNGQPSHAHEPFREHRRNRANGSENGG